MKQHKQWQILVMFFRASYNDLIEKHQPDAVNKYILNLCSVSTCFGQNIAHHQEINKMYKSAYGVRPVIRNSMWYNYALILA